MNLKETIRKVLLEETKLSTYLRRRLAKADLSEVDDIMDQSLFQTELMIKKYFRAGKNEPMTFVKFKSLVLSLFIENLYEKDVFKGDDDAYDELFVYYYEIYNNRIKKYYEDNNIEIIY
jgi:hypothetical protein